ncbi:hypothetical protein BPTFM16_00972 [Altererythrobacter insulae]|nr:hypothetical protein BPTFM16_00972 [Altererythrobacter insulae]
MQPFFSAPRPIRRGRVAAKLNRVTMGRKLIKTPDILQDIAQDAVTSELISLLSSGGDARIVLDGETGLNRYYSAPYPRRTMAYASSTANDLSTDAFVHLRDVYSAGLAPYADHLEQLRGRIRDTYQIGENVEIVFAPSGTDLEYVALAAMLGQAKGGIHNILLGADEVGSGCIHSAHGKFFAEETALGLATEKGTPVDGFGDVSMADVPVRCTEGRARCSETMTHSIAQEIILAQAAGKHALVHVVHGSKTGLILPELAEIDALKATFGDDVDFVVDACQARITIPALHQYLERGAMVFLTGSKFMGGAPFNGWALVPKDMVARASKLPTGLAKVFRRAEFPQSWPGQNELPAGENPGLALRYEASIFELERFQNLPMDQVANLLDVFEAAVIGELVQPLGINLVRPFTQGHEGEPDEHPIEMRTLVTLDVSSLGVTPTFDAAQSIHKHLALNGIRLGQPVKCVRRNNTWGGTLRVGLSMPQVVRFSSMPIGEAEALIKSDMRRIAEALVAVSETNMSHNQYSAC